MSKCKVDEFFSKRDIVFDGILDKNQYIKDLKAVKENGMALKFVKKQTPKICLEAVKQNGYALAYVENQTSEGIDGN